MRWLWIAAVMPWLTGLLWAQVPKGGGAPAKISKLAPAPKATPSGDTLAPPTPDTGEAAAAAAEIQAILDLRPNTPSELIRAAKLLADLKRPDLAKGFLKRALAAATEPKDLVALAEEFGTARFVELKTRQNLAPEGVQLADAVLQARARHLQDPQRIAALIQDLQSSLAEQRFYAMLGLQEAGQAAVGPLVRVLADPQRAAEHATVRAALIELGPSAVDPLLTVLGSSDPKLVVQAIEVLKGMRDPKLRTYLYVPLLHEGTAPEVRAAARTALATLQGAVTTRQQAARQLAETARAYLERLRPLRADVTGQVTIWSWDDAARQPVAKSVAAEQAGRSFAARFARDAYLLLPEDTEIRRLYLVATLEEAAYQTGLDKPLSADEDAPASKAAALGARAIEDALAYAIERDHPGAAAAAAQVLGRQPEAERLLHRAGQPCPLVLATRYSDPRVRLAAIEAILRVQPKESYPGSSYVLEAIGFFASSRGARRALVASPNVERSQRMSGYLAGMGFETDWAQTGRELIRLALQSPDYELAMIDAGIDQPTLDFVVQQLRRDGRTALVPVGIFASDDQFVQARHVAEKTPRAAAFYRPYDQGTAQGQVQRVLALAGPDVPGSADRRRHAAVAFQWLEELSGSPDRRLYDLFRVEAPVLAALDTPDLSARAAAVLGNLGTAESQRALVDLASRATAPLADRASAASAFARSSDKFGILLTIPQIRLQYDRYNQSANQDQPTQKVLGLILDSIEAPTHAAGPPGQATPRQGSTAASVMR